MRKYLLLVLCLVSSLSFAQEILCPESITCSSAFGGCRANPMILGDIWRAYDSQYYAEGTYFLKLIGLTVDKKGLCIYDARSQEIYLSSNVPLYQDLRAPDQRWNLDNNRCISTIAHYCPFTDVKPADGKQ